MPNEIFPKNPAERRAVMILAQEDIVRCRYEGNAANMLLNEELCILPFPLNVNQASAPRALRNIIDADQVRPGIILVQNPYDVDSYVDAALAPQECALDKYQHFSTFCSILGAREVHVEQDTIRSTNGERKRKINGCRMNVTGELDTSTKQDEEFAEKLILISRYDGGEPDLEGAESFLRTKRLWGDKTMHSLFEQFSYSTNRMKERKLHLDLSSEVQKSLSVIAKIGIPSFLECAAEYQIKLKEKSTYSLHVTIRF